MPAGRQISTLTAYMKRSTSSPGTVNASCTFSSITIKGAPGLSAVRIAESTPMGFDMSDGSTIRPKSWARFRQGPRHPLPRT
jgi:hypothetical protein